MILPQAQADHARHLTFWLLEWIFSKNSKNMQDLLPAVAAAFVGLRVLEAVSWARQRTDHPMAKAKKACFCCSRC
jgi:hypothetical protein